MRLVGFPQDLREGHPEEVSLNLLRSSCTLLSPSLHVFCPQYPLSPQVVSQESHTLLYYPGFSEVWGQSTLRLYVAYLLP